VRRLEKPRVRGGYEVPAKRVEVGGEDVRCVEPLAGEMPPVRLLQYLGVRLALPEDRKAFTLGVIFQAGKINERLLPRGFAGRFDGFNQISATANLYDLAN
jgi:hypothetical protein